MKTPAPFQTEDPDLQIAPLIDMTFLLLVYFLTSASLVKSEADLGIRLPGALAQAQTVDMPDEQIIEISVNGVVMLNGKEYDSALSKDLPQLVAVLQRYRASAAGARNEAMITVAAADDTQHQRVIDVMNACAAAGIHNVTFAAVTE
ncbi:MAG: colicin uptake protein TolR [Lentisphaerae bacterium ADurb.BinA184]|nr:MAG: colicin uptake protein TolR [Lentisphaerae bacterium ADurb.BinA184]